MHRILYLSNRIVEWVESFHGENLVALYKIKSTDKHARLYTYSYTVKNLRVISSLKEILIR